MSAVHIIIQIQIQIQILYSPSVLHFATNETAAMRYAVIFRSVLNTRKPSFRFALPPDETSVILTSSSLTTFQRSSPEIGHKRSGIIHECDDLPLLLATRRYTHPPPYFSLRKNKNMSVFCFHSSARTWWMEALPPPPKPEKI